MICLKLTRTRRCLVHVFGEEEDKEGKSRSVICFVSSMNKQQFCSFLVKHVFKIVFLIFEGIVVALFQGMDFWEEVTLLIMQIFYQKNLD